MSQTSRASKEDLEAEEERLSRKAEAVLFASRKAEKLSLSLQESLDITDKRLRLVEAKERELAAKERDLDDRIAAFGDTLPGGVSS